MNAAIARAALAILVFTSISTYANVYVGQAGTTSMIITDDQGASGLDPGDTITWTSDTLGATGGLIFGTNVFTSIQEAVDAVDTGGTVFISNGTYAEGDQITIHKDITLQGDGADITVIDGKDTHRVFHILEGPFEVTFRGLSIIDGLSEGFALGGGISHEGGSLSVQSCMLSGNSALSGGAIASSGGSVTIANSTVFGNRAKGLDYTIQGIPFHRDGLGGGIHSSSNLTVTNSTLSGNGAEYGGGIYASIGAVSLVHATIKGNWAAEGGGILKTHANSSVTVANSIIAGNAYFVSHPDVKGGSFTSNGANFIGKDDSSNNAFADDMSFASTNTEIEDIIDTTLANNGGTTLTYALVPRSLAIDAGKNVDALGPDGSPLTGDQRGPDHPRTGGCSTVDIGAFEFQRRTVSEVYVSLDFDPSDPEPGDTVRWYGADSFDPVEDLIFGTDAFHSIQNAVDAVCPGGTVFIDSGPYHEGEPIIIAKSLTLQGLGPSRTRVSGNRAHRVFDILGGAFDVTFDGLSIIEGRPPDVIPSSGYDRSGGGIRSHSTGTVLVINSSISDNYTFDFGAGILNASNGSVSIINSTLQSNRARASGAGACNGGSGNLKILNSSLLENRADAGGGGISNHEDGRTQIINSSLSGNIARHGGGILNLGITSLINSTLTRNDANRGGGVHTGRGTFWIANSIVAGNSAQSSSADLYGALFASNGANFIGLDESLNNTFGNDLTFASTGVGIHDVIGPLDDNGGPTLTHGLVEGSPAIGVGDPSHARDIEPNPSVRLIHDQRGTGFRRFSWSNGSRTVDIGSVQFRSVSYLDQWNVESPSDGDDSFVEVDPNDFTISGTLGPGNGLPPLMKIQPGAESGGMDLEINFFPGNPDLVWSVERSTDLRRWVEIYRLDEEGEYLGELIAARSQPEDPDRIIVTDEDTGFSTAYYRLRLTLREAP